jgi:prepilin signal peptidase PulO-like enzyme (type II secretory pathway)
VFLSAGRKKLNQAIAFGPFMVIGSLAALFWGKEIINWYLSLT